MLGRWSATAWRPTAPVCQCLFQPCSGNRFLPACLASPLLQRAPAVRHYMCWMELRTHTQSPSSRSTCTRFITSLPLQLSTPRTPHAPSHLPSTCTHTRMHARTHNHAHTHALTMRMHAERRHPYGPSGSSCRQAGRKACSCGPGVCVRACVRACVCMRACEGPSLFVYEGQGLRDIVHSI